MAKGKKNKNTRPKVYLAGRMSFDDPRDKAWREEITPLLNKLGFKVLNPYLLEPLQLKGKHIRRLPDGYKHWYELRHHPDEKQQERFKAYMRAIIKFDLKIVKEVADIIIVRWSDGCTTGAGTHGEVSFAFDFGKPVICVDECVKGKVPDWIFACCERVFKTMEETLKFVKEQYSDADDIDLSEELIN